MSKSYRHTSTGRVLVLFDRLPVIASTLGLTCCAVLAALYFHSCTLRNITAHDRGQTSSIQLAALEFNTAMALVMGQGTGQEHARHRRGTLRLAQLRHTLTPVAPRLVAVISLSAFALPISTPPSLAPTRTANPVLSLYPGQAPPVA